MFVNKLLDAVLAGKMRTDRALGLLGEFIKSGIQLQIDKVFLPPLADATIRARPKHTTKPLIDTGTMRASVTYKKVIAGKPK